MDDGVFFGVLIFMSTICLILVLIFFGVGLEGVNSERPIENMGQMVCGEKGYGDFIEFDKSTKTIKCEPKPQKEKYDGGYIEVVDNDMDI